MSTRLAKDPRLSSRWLTEAKRAKPQVLAVIMRHWRKGEGNRWYLNEVARDLHTPIQFRLLAQRYEVRKQMYSDGGWVTLWSRSYAEIMRETELLENLRKGRL